MQACLVGARTDQRTEGLSCVAATTEIGDFCFDFTLLEQQDVVCLDVPVNYVVAVHLVDALSGCAEEHETVMPADLIAPKQEPV
jgi:hypothetical protein